MKKDCVFCKISRGEIKEEILYRDKKVFVVRDIHPRVPAHFLIVTSEHFGGFTDLVGKAPELVSHIALVVEIIADKFNLRKTSRFGYTWGFHCGGKESVAHVHAQLLAGMKKGELVL